MSAVYGGLFLQHAAELLIVQYSIVLNAALVTRFTSAVHLTADKQWDPDSLLSVSLSVTRHANNVVQQSIATRGVIVSGVKQLNKIPVESRSPAGSIGARVVK